MLLVTESGEKQRQEDEVNFCHFIVPFLPHI